MSEKHISEKRHWNSFWEQSPDVNQVYDNEERVSRHFTEIVPPEGLRILEVGAGSGRDGILFSRMGARVVSLDYSKSALGLVKSQLSSGDSVDLCCGDAFSLPFKDETFDLVFHQGLLEHFRNPDDMIKEHKRVIKKGGYLLVDVPQRYHYYTVGKHLLISLGKWFAGWETEYSVKELERMLERQGLTVVKSYGEWLNPPIWFRMLRKGLVRFGIRISMYPAVFSALRKIFQGPRRFILNMRCTLYTAVVIGSIARKD
ncbi:MAG: class I SAM-dependent methyltransferase [Candidatus Krumholzibacteriota bacterium]|nr:class I SAM-dependent methyltransferase [Candidatus Krumholzibacteriota bacterium]